MAENMRDNAKQIYSFFRNKGWSSQSICGMLGNMQGESGIIADINEVGGGGGYGLVQWTPKSKLVNWANANSLNYRTVETQCKRIQWELENGEQFYSTNAYPMNFRQFTQSTKSPTYLAAAFIHNYERPANANQPQRGVWAEAWYKDLTTNTSSTTLEWKLQVATALHMTGSNYRFLVGDYNGDGVDDLYVIKTSGTSNGMTEVHILNGKDNFQSYLLQTATALASSDGWDFGLADYNGNGKLDLYAFYRSTSSTRKSEVHVLDGSKKFSAFLFQITIPVYSMKTKVDFFKVADQNGDKKPDIYLIKTANTGSGKTEVHVLNAADNFQSFSVHSSSVLHMISDGWDFGIGHYNGDGKPDIYGFSKSGASGKTEVHILNGADSYSSFLLHMPTLLASSGNNFEFIVKGSMNIYAIKKSGTGSGKTEVHLMGYK